MIYTIHRSYYFLSFEETILIKVGKGIIFIFALMLTTFVRAQEKVEWQLYYDDKTETIAIIATIAEGWHLYSQHLNNEIGPVPTSFIFEANDKVKIIGETTEPESLKEYDENFEAELNFFKESVTFSQKVKVSESGQLNCTVTFMVCNDTMCLPPRELTFTIPIKK